MIKMDLRHRIHRCMGNVIGVSCNLKKEFHMSNDSQKTTRGGTSEQHAKAGSQSHKNSQQAPSRGGSREQHAKAGSQSHKNK
jgi:hypothetical protein